MTYLIVGLGNPGSQYEKTRHNVGFRVVERFASGKGWVFHSTSDCQGKVAHGKVGDKSVFLLKPSTFMNNSGVSVKRCVEKWKVPLDKLIVVQDEIAFPLGEVRLKGQGSSGGHNGIDSVSYYLGTEYYSRLRIGIGAPDLGTVLADYVLAPFSIEEEKGVGSILERSLFLLDVWLERGKEAAMQIANARKKIEKEEGEDHDATKGSSL